MVSAHFWPLAMTAILGYLVNSAVRTLLFGYFGRRSTAGAAFLPRVRLLEPAFGAWLTADSIINYVNTNLSTLVLARILGASVAGYAPGLQRCGRPADEAQPDYHPRVVPGVRQNSGRR
ncbi:oligosaccharide flippase family protein [Escherichia coli]